MDIWIIQNGEKIGPIHDFEVRKKIEAGELAATTPAWHEGLPAWKPLVEISLFEREFDRPIDPPEAPPEQVTEAPVPPPLPDRLFSLRRFWARWLDLYLFAGLWWYAMWATGRDIGSALSNVWVIMLFYVPWFVVEAILLHRFGTTPGKWLLGIRVVNNDGSHLNLADATRRSARVLFVGIGFGLDIVTMVCQIMAYFTTKRLGRPIWDHAGGHRVTVAPLAPLRIVAFVVILFFSLQLRAIVVVPYLVEEAAKSSPMLKEFFEKYPPWHLPKR
jgi:uncharacterized RDD family membrane protein YckC